MVCFIRKRRPLEGQQNERHLHARVDGLDDRRDVADGIQLGRAAERARAFSVIRVQRRAPADAWRSTVA